MIFGLFCMLTANAAVLLASRALLAKIETGVGPVDVVLFLLLRILLISAAVILAGVTGTLTPTWLGLVGAATLIALVACGAHRTLRIPQLPEVGVLAGIFAAVMLARLLAQVWFFAPYPGDVLSYHLPKVAEWVRAGAFTREMGVDTHVTFPAGFELIETWWVLFLHHDALIEMAGVEFLALGAISVYALAKGIGLKPESSFVAALLYALTPVVHIQATACVNDAPAGALILASAALIDVRARMPLLFLAAGLGVGIKPIYAYALPGLALLYWLRRPTPVTGLPSPRAGIVLAATGVATGLFWFIRNALWFGNPIHPVGMKGLHGPHSIQFGARPSSLFANLNELFNSKIYDNSVPYGAFTVDMAGWGILAFALGGVALVFAARAEPRFRRLALALGVSVVCVLLLVQRDPWCLRFVLFFPAVLCIATAWFVERSRTAGALACGLALLQFAGTCLPREIPLPLFKEFVGQSWHERSMAKTAGIELPTNKVGYFVDNRNLAYLLYRSDYSREVVYLRATSVDDLLLELERNQIQFLYAASASIGHAGILEEAQQRGRISKVGNRIYVLAQPDDRLKKR